MPIVKPADVQIRLQQALGAAYAIERELSGGGMSRVFVADEVALGRKVVVKVLRPDLGEALSAERFKREVRLAARLQHPHIVPLLAAGEIGDGVLFYTMPFVEGESLRERLLRDGALPVADAVRILCDVAGALAHAHRAGVVHRDVKPENILLSDGGAVVADFGIAKAITASRQSEGDGEVRHSSTLTAVGTSLGTPAYMAPEQAAGDAVDHRADLYALGVVGYEMLAGRAPFEGRTAQQVLAAHATEAPEFLAKRRATVPPALGALIMQLLEKNPADRVQSADELRHTLDGLSGRQLAADTAAATPADSEGQVASAGTSGVRHRATQTPSRGRSARFAALALVGATTALVGAGIGAMLAGSRVREAPRRPIVAALVAPSGQELSPDGGVALSPDGSQLALVAADRSGATAIWIRPLDTLDARRVEGTDGGSGPFWSPDGASLGYFAGGQLRVVELGGGTRRVLCAAARPGGGTWTKNGDIVYSPDFLSTPLFKVPAAGGACTQLTRFGPGESIHRRPSALPDGRHVVFSSGVTTASRILAVDIATGAVTEVRGSGGDPQFVSPDWIIFRDAETTSLYAQRLDLASLRPLGEPRVVLARILNIRSIASYTASSSALVAFQLDVEARSLVWVSRQSAVVDSVLSPRDAVPYLGAASVGLSGDGRRIAFAAGGPMWLYDRDRKVATRAHAETMAGEGILDPEWSPGDSLIAYRTLFGKSLTLRRYHVRTDSSDSLFSSGRRNVRTPAWSPEGRRIAFQLSAGDSAMNDEIWVYSLDDRRAFRVWEASGNLSSPGWSPDGRWLAYVSDETGAPEVYMRPVSGPGVAVRVSTSGGDYPRWRADGRELYFRAPNGAIMRVGVTLGVRVALSLPTELVAAPPFSRTLRWFDVTQDGQRFVAFGEEAPLLFTLVLDWAAPLSARQP